MYNRWFSIKLSVNKPRDCYASIVINVQREGGHRGDAKALGMQAIVTEYIFVATKLLMWDALPHVTQMSKYFKPADCDYSIIPSLLGTTVTSLEQLMAHNGLNIAQFNAFLKDLDEGSIKIKKPANMSQDYFNDNICIPFHSCLANNINHGFHNQWILESFDVLHPSKVPTFWSNPTKTEIEHFIAYHNEKLAK